MTTDTAVPDLSDVQSGLEGVVAFATEIAEPDKAGGALRYRGVDIEDLVGVVPFEHVWGLLVDGTLLPGLPPAEPWPLTVRSGDPRVDVQSCLAMLGPEWGFQPLIDIEDDQARSDLARASVMALSFVAQSARGSGVPPVPQRLVDQATSIPERFLIRWRGEANPDHIKAIDAYWISAAEHGMNASTFTARVIASTGADVAAALSGAVGALSGPLHGGAPSRVLKMLDEVEKSGDAEKYVKDLLDRGERLMGFGHRVYRAEDPRARVRRRARCPRCSTRTRRRPRGAGGSAPRGPSPGERAPQRRDGWVVRERVAIRPVSRTTRARWRVRASGPAPRSALGTRGPRQTDL